jgi:HK97 family phage portal protein
MAGLIETIGSMARGAARGAIQSLGELRRSDAPNQVAGGAPEAPKSVMLDPYGMVASMGYRERPTAVSYQTLKAMSYRAPVVGSIIQTRVNQVSSFARPQPNRYATGYKISMRSERAKPTKASIAYCEKLTRFMHQTGVTQEGVRREDLETYLKKLCRDTLTYGHDATEVQPNRRGLPAGFVALDATTVRLADNDRLNDQEGGKDKICYVQIYDGVIINEYTNAELAFGIRNPVTDIRMQGYGIGEMEMLIETITNLINTWDYNANFFKNGSAPKGMLNFKGTISGEMIDAFRRHWFSMIQGVENAFRTPISNSPEGVEWIPMQMNNRDMEMSAFNEVLIKATCGVFAIDPAEINFSFGNQGQTQAMGGQSNQEKFVHSQERGLRPLLSHFASTLNKHVLWPIDEDFKFEFVGLDAMTRDQEADYLTKQIKSYKTVNEIRAAEDMPPLKDGAGDIILDPTFLQNKSMSMAPPDDGGGQGGGPTDDGNGGQDDAANKSLSRLSLSPPSSRIIIPGMRPVDLPASFAKSYSEEGT